MGYGYQPPNTDHTSVRSKEVIGNDWLELGVFSHDGVKNSFNFVKTCYTKSGLAGLTTVQVRGVYAGPDPSHVGEIYFISEDSQTVNGIYGIEWQRTLTPLPNLTDVTIEIQMRKTAGLVPQIIIHNTTWIYQS